MVELKKKIISCVKCNSSCIVAILLALVFYSGILPVWNRYPFISILEKQNITEVQGKIISNPKKTAKGTFYRCIMELESASGFIYSNKSNKEQKITCESKGRISVFIPSEIVEAHYPGKLYSSYSGAKGKEAGILIESGARLAFSVKYATMNSIDKPGIVPVEPIFFVSEATFLGFENNLFGKIEKARGLSRLQFKRLMYAWKDSGGLLLALISGSSEYTDGTISEAFRDAGLAHILALSGMHLSFFAGLAALLTKFFGKRVSDLASIMLVLLFVWFAGLTPSLLRALLFTLIGYVVRKLGLAPTSLQILSLCFLIHISIAPQDLFQLSFQLSYASLAGIILCTKLFEPLFYHRLPPALASGLSTSCGAQSFSVPISVSVFGNFAPAGILATTVVSPLVTIFLATGVFCIFISLLCPYFIQPLGEVMNLLYTCIASLVKLFARIPLLELK